MRVLIIEDDDNNRTILSALLSKFGEVETASRGQEGLDLFVAAHEKSTPFDLICVDIMMPGMDGLEVLERIRAEENTRELYLDGHAKVIMLTAVAEKNVVIDAFKRGCEAYLVKPLDPDELYHQLKVLHLVDERTITSQRTKLNSK